MLYKRSSALFAEAEKVIPGGVNSPVRAFKAVGGTPIFAKSAKGAYVFDEDGNRYIDYINSWGPMILGHAFPPVVDAVIEKAKLGTSFGMPTEMETQIAALAIKMVPGIDKIRFVNSGTEACMSAIRLARGFTKKDKIIKFSGCYHGHQDALLVAAGSGLATLSLPGSKGVPEGAVQNTLIAEYNNLESVKAHFEAHDDIAGVIIEPVGGNMGVVIPQNNFLKELKDYLKTKGALLIADEVMTGFRSKFGGAQELFGVTADITCLGKVIGGGFPVGAYGARNEIMEQVAPLGAMYQAGTLSGNPIAMAGGIATLSELKKQNPYDKFEKIGNTIEAILLTAAKKYNVALVVNRFGSMMNPFFTESKVTNFEEAQTSDTEKFAVFFWEMIKNGVFLPPSQFEAWFLNSAISDKDINVIAKATDKAMLAVSKI